MTSRPYFPSLAGLRCLAIVPVVWHHATPGPLPGVLGRGPLGVDLFFAISGFLITTLLLHEKRHGGIGLRAFYVRRSLRIFPLYYAVLGAFVLHAMFLRAPGETRSHFFASLPFHATYTSNWFVPPASHPIVFAFGWSLATEEQFYAVWPPLLRVFRGTLAPALAMIGLLALARWAEPLGLEGTALRVARSFATPIGLGSLLALLRDRTSLVDTVLARRESSILALALVVLGAIRAWPLLPVHLAMTALVGAVALRRDHLLAPLLEHRVLRHIGVVSYGVYLLNVPIVYACRSFVERPLPLFVVGLTASVLAATLTYRYIERPFLALR